MKTAEAVFMLHGDITRKSKLLEIVGDQKRMLNTVKY